MIGLPLFACEVLDEQRYDVDVFIIMEDSFEVSQVTGEAAIVFDHQAAQNLEGASVFWIRWLAAIGGEQAAIEYWEVKRGAKKRGIVERRRML